MTCVIERCNGLTTVVLQAGVVLSCSMKARFSDAGDSVSQSMPTLLLLMHLCDIADALQPDCA